MGDLLRDILQLIGLIPLWAGVVFCGLGVLGMFRFPDVYSRLHAAGKVSTMGLAGVLLGGALIMPSTALKAIALAVFIVITSPVATHAIAMAAYRSGVSISTIKGEVRDDMKEMKDMKESSPSQSLDAEGLQ
jgi:multicomponent Na+:H+ antiporter subunit G